MGKTLTEIAEQLNNSEKKVQLIYAFNGAGKTRLSREFKELIAPKISEIEPSGVKFIYYSAFTEDLFYWDNDLDMDAERKLKIQPNSFTDWVLKDQGQDQNIITTFQRYTNNKLTPRFNEEFSEVIFSLERGDDERSDNLKISKGEESNFIWSIFYTLLELVIDVLNIAEPDKREISEFDHLEYIFIDDPVSSLDENHLIQVAIDLAELIKINKSDVKFIITTHNPLFYNVLHNELNNDKYSYKRKHCVRWLMTKLDDGTYNLDEQPNDSPFSYHLYLKLELEKAIESDYLSKFHFNFLRNILEKTSTFLGYKRWEDLLPRTEDETNPYEARIINLCSHSKHAGEEVPYITEDDKRVLRYLVQELNKMYRFHQAEG